MFRGRDRSEATPTSPHFISYNIQPLTLSPNHRQPLLQFSTSPQHMDVVLSQVLHTRVTVIRTHLHPHSIRDPRPDLQPPKVSPYVLQLVTVPVTLPQIHPICTVVDGRLRHSLEHLLHQVTHPQVISLRHNTRVSVHQLHHLRENTHCHHDFSEHPRILRRPLFTPRPNDLKLTEF
jgi:hypothetical protein